MRLSVSNVSVKKTALSATSAARLNTQNRPSQKRKRAKPQENVLKKRQDIKRSANALFLLYNIFVKRLFVKSLPEKDIEIIGTEHNHLTQVLRAQIGERVVIFCGDEFEYTFEITNITKKSILLKFIRKDRCANNPKVSITVFLAAIKHENLSLVVQKLNEIGVKEIVIFDATRSNVSTKNLRIERLESIAEQSCKQCGRSIPVKITFGNLGGLCNFDKIIFADENHKDDLLGTLSLNNKDSIAAIIGPEGGFTDAERKEILSHKNVVSVSLGKRIFRAETAAIAVSSIILSKVGEI